MKRIFSLLVLAISLSLSAQIVSIDQAKNRAYTFLKTEANTSKLSKKTSSKESLTLAHTYQQDNTPHFYIFNNNSNGFIIVSANEVAEEILGYSDRGNFDINNISPNLRYWLEQYDRQIAFAIADGAKPMKKTSLKAAAREEIDIMVPTRWDQCDPYWRKCPKKKGKNCLTGCVATAMSQVMKTYNWPVTGTGSHTYTDTPDEAGWGTGLTLTADFSSHTYDWDNMLNIYKGTITDEQKDAVALLMSDCGISVNMTYGTDSEGGSGAFTEFVPYAFANFFGYDKTVGHRYRDYYTNEDWADIIYKELAEGRPVMYGGSSNDGGHSFICDGYQKSSGKFHFNFGWSGDDDGYFSLSSIGNYPKYNYYNDIILGIQPEAGGEAIPYIIFYDDCYLESKEKQSGEYTTYNLTFGTYKDDRTTEKGFIWNDTWCKADVFFTMKYTNISTGEIFYAKAKDDAANRVQFDEMYGVVAYPAIESLSVKDVVVPKLPAGDYRVSLAYKKWEDKDAEEEPWQDVLAFTSAKNYVTMTVEPKVATPEIKDATDITSTGFTANWGNVEGATSYTLELIAKANGAQEESVLLDEKFEDVRGNENTEISSKLDDYTQEKGWKGSKVFCSEERVKLGSGSNGWYLMTPTISIDDMSNVKVIVTEDKYGSDNSTFTTAILDKNEIAISSVTENAEGKTHELSFENISGDINIKFFNDQGKQRMYIDDIKVIVGGGGKATTTTYENIKDTCYVFTSLSSDSTYYYKVKAEIDGEFSKWSESKKVELSGGILLGDANNDGKVDVADITTIASYILGLKPEPWNEVNADANKDGVIDVADITTVATIILNKN